MQYSESLLRNLPATPLASGDTCRHTKSESPANSHRLTVIASTLQNVTLCLLIPLESEIECKAEFSEICL